MNELNQEIAESSKYYQCQKLDTTKVRTLIEIEHADYFSNLVLSKYLLTARFSVILNMQIWPDAQRYVMCLVRK